MLMDIIITLIEKCGLAAIVVFILFVHVIPMLRKICDEISALVILLARKNGFSIDDLEKARTTARGKRRK